ncbi:MAG TPA: lysylphosphatidylglycerol synthase domain-containing protein, partial [Polyangia bacterium]|nr:lysylphosphatidylglycerol synthase domain-containing protein [Polyangia bacterium]
SLADNTGDFYDGVGRLLGPRLLLDGLLTLGAYAVLFAGAALLAMSLGIEVTAVEAGLLLGLANLVALVPVTVAGVGTRDAVFVLAFPALGLTEAQALAFSALVLAAFFLGTGLFCFPFFAADRFPAAEHPVTGSGD